MDFATRLRNFRIKNHLRQEDVAALTGSYKTSISRWENGNAIREDIQKRVEKAMADYEAHKAAIQPTAAPVITPKNSSAKGSNPVTTSENGSTVAANLKSLATDLGLAVLAVRRAEVKLDKQTTTLQAVQAELDKAQTDFEKAKADLAQIEEALLAQVE